MGGCWQQSSALLPPVVLLEVVLGGRMGPPWCQGGLYNVSSMAPAPAAAPSCGFLLPGAVVSKGVQRRLPLPAHAGEFPVPGWLGSTRGSQGHLQPPCTQPEDLPSGRAVGPSSESCEGPVCHVYPSTTTGGPGAPATGVAHVHRGPRGLLVSDCAGGPRRPLLGCSSESPGEEPGGMRWHAAAPRGSLLSGLPGARAAALFISA